MVDSADQRANFEAPKPVPSSEITSDNDVFDRMSQYFKWVDKTKLTTLLSAPKLNDWHQKDPVNVDFDILRIVSNKRMGLIQTLNPHEQDFLTLFNICSAIELAQTLKDNQLNRPGQTISEPPNQTDLSSRSIDQLTSLLEELTANISRVYDSFQSTTQKLELELFGTILSDLTNDDIHMRFTNLPQQFYTANYHDPDHTLITNTRYVASAGLTYDQYNSLVAHELGHAGILDRQKKGFRREEIWNEWKSVLLPLALSHDNLKYANIYHTNPTTKEAGGAFTLHTMVADLRKCANAGELIVGGKSYSLDDVMRSALLTAHTGQEKGMIKTPASQDAVIAFADLYDGFCQLKGSDSSYEIKLKGCDDRDYLLTSLQ